MARFTDKQRIWLNEYLQCLNATEAARRAGYKHAKQMGSENLSKPVLRQEIDRRLEAKTMSGKEVLARLDEQARADIGIFFKIVEEWTFYPLSTCDIIDAIEVKDTSDPDNPKTRINYFVRRIAIDTDKVMDPRYSHLLHQVADSPRGGLKIELYDKQKALIQLGKHYALFTEKIKHEDWRDTALEYIRNQEVSYEALADECGADLATELFKLAGVPIET